MKRYIVAWHEDNDSGAPKHVMGVSMVFDTREDAEEWIENAIAEDADRAAERGEGGLTVDDTVDGVHATWGNNQKTYYKVEEIEWEDRAAECIRIVEKILDASEPNPPTDNLAVDRVRRALLYIREHEREWMPMRRWDVDIHFSPAGCVHSVFARTADEAREIVNDRLDKEGVDIFTSEQKAEMMDTLIENVESIEVLGPGED